MANRLFKTFIHFLSIFSILFCSFEYQTDDVVRQQSRLELGKQHGSEKRPLPMDSNKMYITENSLKQIKFISTPPFCLFDRPSNQVIFDEHNDNQIFGLFKFIPFSSMTFDELNNLDFLAEFLHDHN
ncbi:hypothetical protein VP01_1467g2 [Puccinia sorghi]|uniref:Uncharacterized protein n=1 Tax=Puccinia sorghi TaxID=27349 RepID=A0A0L6VJW1_9BASI|nr:hypothetical protein VP01_1467g1 [Puccinia sorghi]KNZ60999.1 hypothetical protein VP01_1467g2 [Puccinia sorghi]